MKKNISLKWRWIYLCLILQIPHSNEKEQLSGENYELIVPIHKEFYLHSYNAMLLHLHQSPSTSYLSSSSSSLNIIIISHMRCMGGALTNCNGAIRSSHASHWIRSHHHHHHYHHNHIHIFYCQGHRICHEPHFGQTVDISKYPQTAIFRNGIWLK